MIYLLQNDLTPSGYLLMKRIDDSKEVFYHCGDWHTWIPITFEHGSTEDMTYKNGEPINWWTKAYPDYVDAKIVVRCKTEEGYLKWVSEHPELFI
jgi:hypothetical protein